MRVVNCLCIFSNLLLLLRRIIAQQKFFNYSVWTPICDFICSNQAKRAPHNSAKTGSFLLIANDLWCKNQEVNRHIKTVNAWSTNTGTQMQPACLQSKDVDGKKWKKYKMQKQKPVLSYSNMNNEFMWWSVTSSHCRLLGTATSSH